MTKLRKRLNEKEAEFLGLDILSVESGKGNPKYTLEDWQWETILKSRTTPNKREFVETIKKLDKDGELISTVEKLQSEPIEVPENFELIKVSTSKTTGQQWLQYAPKKVEDAVNEIDYESIIKKHINKVSIKKVKSVKTKDFDTLTYTDVHVAMETDKYKNSMYAVDWNKKEILKTAELIVNRTIQEKESDILYIDELGDLMDGYNGLTTRGGHSLPQNMTNEEAFDCALSFKMYLVDNLIHHYKKIVCNNICNDNHAGAFGYFVNSAFKNITDLKYKNVKVVNHRKFINHYYVGRIAFVITHGKDDMTLKFGFKPTLKPDAIEKIDQYCKHNNIYKNSDLVIFKKGDSHQALFDMCSSDDFYYFNYPALSPSSQWVQNNFKKGRRGFFNESFKDLDTYLKPKFITS